MVYLDNAATTFPKPESVYAEMDRVNREMAFNASRGSYEAARKASALISETKRMIRDLVNAEVNAPVVFSSSITLALNQIVNGLNLKNDSNVYLSPFEHNAVARTIYYLSQKTNINIHFLPLKENTFEIDIKKLEYLFIQNKPNLVICTHISNVTGYILPVVEIFDLAKKYEAITVLDSAQSLGLIKVDAKRLNADLIAFAGHKSLYGPIGIGGFINNGNIPLSEFIVGGTGSDSLNLSMPNGLESMYEASSCNIVAIAGLRAAIKSLDSDDIYSYEKELTEYLVSELRMKRNIKLYVPNSECHIGIVSFTVEGYSSEDVGKILDEEFDIAVRTGYHCAPFIHDYLKDKSCQGTVRVGIGRYNTKEDICSFISAINTL